MDLSRVKSIRFASLPKPKVRVPAYLHISKSTLIAIGVMALVVGLVTVWAYHYTRLTQPSYVCSQLGLAHLRYEKERELVTEELGGRFVNGYRYSLHFQGISADGYRVLIQRTPTWHKLGPGVDRYYASNATQPEDGKLTGDFYAQTDIKYCTLTYTAYVDKLLPVTILWLIAFVVGITFAVSLAVVLLSISIKAARGTKWPSNYATWRSAMLVSGASLIMVAIALVKI